MYLLTRYREDFLVEEDNKVERGCTTVEVYDDSHELEECDHEERPEVCEVEWQLPSLIIFNFSTCDEKPMLLYCWVSPASLSLRLRGFNNWMF